MTSSKRFLTHKLLTTACALALGSTVASAHDVYLKAMAFDKAVPNTSDGSSSASIAMWGYAECDATFTTCSAPTSPGPQITVPTGDSTLTVHLQNALTEPTSVYIPGQVKALTPTRNGGRVDSFDAVTAPGATGTYTWSNVRSGTYLYQSGSHVQLQVQMGLYGAMVKDADCAPLTCAYAGVPYEVQKTVIFSEIDPALHATPRAANAMPNNATSHGYSPRYFLINGEVYTSAANNPLASLLTAQPGNWTLLRLVNAGLQNRAPQLLGGYFEVLAEDGNRVPGTHQQYTTLLAPAKTMDVRFTPAAAGSFKILDRRLGLVNDAASNGGMLANVAVSGNAVDRPVANASSFAGSEDTPLAANLLTGQTATAAIVESPPSKGQISAIAPNGDFTYTPGLNFNGADTFTFRVANGNVGSLPATATITVAPVNDAPVANADAYFVNSNAYSVAAPGILANDTDIDGDALNVDSPSALGGLTANADGSLSFASTAVGDYSFTYFARDNSSTPAPLSSATPATVHLVRDVVISTATSVNNTTGNTNNGRWRFTGNLRIMTGSTTNTQRTVIFTFEPTRAPGGCNIGVQNLGLATGSATAVVSFSVQTNNNLSNNARNLCHEGTVHATVAAFGGYASHTVDIPVTIP